MALPFLTSEKCSSDPARHGGEDPRVYRILASQYHGIARSEASHPNLTHSDAIPPNTTTGAGACVPHEVDFEVRAQLDEELVHLAEVGGVAVGVEHRELGGAMAHVHGDHLRAPLRPHPPRLDVAPPRHARELHHLAAAHVPLLRRRSTIARRLGRGRLHPVRRRVWREEGEAGGDRRGDGAHLGLGFAPQMAAVRTARGRGGGKVVSGQASFNGRKRGGGEGQQTTQRPQHKSSNMNYLDRK
jgi:hypothetical protein